MATTHDDILRAIGRIEGRLAGIDKLFERVSALETWQSWLKGGWAAVLGLYAWLVHGSCGSLKGIGLVLILPLLFSASACAAHYSLHPGALNKTDSAAYDAVLIAETTIDQARLDDKAGRLPADAKDALDALIRSYNVARASWLTYRGALATNVASQIYFDQLTNNLSDLTNAIREFAEVK